MSNTTHHPIIEINGFSIKNGVGTEINREVNTPVGLQTITERVGGGLFVYVNSPKVNDSQFLNNGITTTNKGGAVFASSGGDDIGFPDRDHYQNHPDLEPAEGPLDFSNNTFLGNDAMYGHSIFIEGFPETISNLTSCYFDVYDSTLEGSSADWIKGLGSAFDETGGAGAETAADIRGQLFGKRLPNQDQCVPVGQAFKVVVQQRITVGPDDVAVPIQL